MTDSETTDMHATEIRPDIFWIGAIDYNLRDFHGYALAPYGTTYNSYLLKGEKNILFDTVHPGFKDEMFRRVREVMKPEDIDYIVVNHIEPDHAGCLAEAVKLINPEKIICSKTAGQLLGSMYGINKDLIVIAGETPLDAGNKTVEFLETKMLHWPDSMVSYIPEDRLLISSDAFGQNLAGNERFDDQVDNSLLMREAARYYANIILPFSPLVPRILQKIEAKGWKIDMIAPDHGLIWRNRPDEIIKAYLKWAEQKPSPKAVVVYDTMWKSTEKMALMVAEGLDSEDISVRLMNLKNCHHSDVMLEMLDAGAILAGSPTHNNGILPLMSAMMTYMKGLKPANIIGAAFGSYGWSGESADHLTESLKNMKAEIVSPALKVKNRPSSADLEKCHELGRLTGRILKEKLSAK